MRTSLLLASAASLAVVSAARAHHSPAAYDTGAEVVLEGTLIEVDWRNPHIFLTLATTGPDGGAVDQEIEVAAVSQLLPNGVTRDSFPVGEPVSVRAFPNRRGGGRTALGLTMTRGDGTVLPLSVLAPAQAPHATPAQGVEGVWVPPSAGLTTLLQEVQGWPFTDEGRAEVAAFIAAPSNAQIDCVPFPPPALMFYPVRIELALDDDEAIIDIDWMDSRRIVHMDGEERPNDVAPSLMGYSVGHWEGDTLVVDTSGFTENRQGLSPIAPSGPGKHLVEHFSLADDGAHLTYELMLEDPQYLTDPVTLTAQWAHRPDLAPSGLPCDLETARRSAEGE